MDRSHQQLARRKVVQWLQQAARED
jgi:hypothetical protein